MLVIFLLLAPLHISSDSTRLMNPMPNQDTAPDFELIGLDEKFYELKFDLGFPKLGYVTFCKNCNGCNTGINIPVSFESQGLRK